MADQPKNKFEYVSYLSGLASIAMYLDKTGVEYHPMKEHLSAEFMDGMEELAEMIDKEQEQQHGR